LLTHSQAFTRPTIVAHIQETFRLPASHRADWLAAAATGDLNAKQRLAEELGEEGTRIIAKARGHTAPPGPVYAVIVMVFALLAFIV
jgi:hypothetical protein